MIKKGSGWRNESHRHRLAGMGIKTNILQSKYEFDASHFHVSARKPVRWSNLNKEIENRILVEFRTAYKIPNNSYIEIEYYDSNWDDIENVWEQIFVFGIYDKDNEEIIQGNGSFRIVNAEVETNPRYPSILDIKKGTLVNVNFDIELALERLNRDENEEVFNFGLDGGDEL